MADGRIERFGVTADGRTVEAVTIGRGDIRARILTWGAVLQGVWLSGLDRSLTLGSDRLSDYEGAMRYHGSLIAPVANRISGARAELDGAVLHFDANPDGRMALHSGAAGTHLKIWRLEAADEGGATLALDLPHGEGGFPGSRRVEARFEVTGATALRLTVTARTDRPTLFNAANHSYWNLDGAKTWAGHRLRIAAEEVLPTDADFCPTGEVHPVAGGELDFRMGLVPVPGAPALDNCFVLARARRMLTPVLWLEGTGGLRMEVATTEPGMQLYDGRAAIRPGRAAYEGFAIEAQGWPDAPNRVGFPSIVLRPGETMQQVTEWRFSR